MSLNVLKEIEKVYLQYENYAEQINEIGLSDLHRSELWLLMKERLDILDRLILMADVFPKKAKCYMDCSLKGQHECNV